MSSLYCRATSVVPATPAADQTDKEGYLVNLSAVAGVLTSTVSASASTVATGVILEGATTSKKSSIAILGATGGTVRLKLGGTVAAGARIQQHTDGSVITDAATGARVIVGVCLESGVSGDLVECAVFTPVTLS